MPPHPGVDWLSVSPAAPGSGVNITRQRGVSLDASTRSSSSGTSMSISSNSKLKAAFTWAGHTTPAVALFSRPTRLSSSRSARVIFSRRWQPAMAHLTGTLLGISPILQRQIKVRVRTRAQTGEPHQLSPAGHSVQPHDRRARNSGPGLAAQGLNQNRWLETALFTATGWKCPQLVAEWVAGKPSCNAFGRMQYFRYSSQG